MLLPQRGSGSSGQWRAVPQAPQYVVDDATQVEDFVQRMDRRLWGRPTIRIKRMKQVMGTTRTHKPGKFAAAAWDLAVAFAVHAMLLEQGPERERAARRCLDALESAIAEGHSRPAPDHPDFAGVAAEPRFLALADPDARRRA